MQNNITSSLVISSLLTALIIVLVSLFLSPNDSEQYSGIENNGLHKGDSSQLDITYALTDDNKEITWKLPSSISTKFSIRLSVPAETEYVFDMGEMGVERQILQTVYTHPLILFFGDVEIAKVDIEFRHTDNGDLLYFINAGQLQTGVSVEGQSPMDEAPLLSWQVVEKDNGQSEQLYYIEYDADKIDNTTSVWRKLKNEKDEEMVVLPKAAIFTDNIRFGMVDVFSTLGSGVIVENFELGQAGYITNVKADNSVDGAVAVKRIWNVKLPLINQNGENLLTEHWGVLSADKLLSFAEASDGSVLEMKEYVSVQDARIADLDRFRKMRTNGIYYEVPTSYIPYKPGAYWRVPAEHIGERFVRSILEQKQTGSISGNSYLDTISIVSLNHSILNQTTSGYWISSPRSGWLYDDYGVEAGFYDTRFSTDAALFLLKSYQYYSSLFKNNEQTETELQTILQTVANYANFLVNYAQEHSYITKNGGLLVQDYIHPTIINKPTHVSLNHLVTEMNFLLLFADELLSHTGNIGHTSDTVIAGDAGHTSNVNSYLEIAAKIRQAVHDTSVDWVKDNNDLWYAYMPDGSYGLLDYPRLTRNDLRISVDLIDRLWQEDDSVFKELIYYKEKYLVENGLPLW